jgi:hypothetical protein
MCSHVPQVPNVLIALVVLSSLSHMDTATTILYVHMTEVQKYNAIMVLSQQSLIFTFSFKNFHVNISFRASKASNSIWQHVFKTVQPNSTFAISSSFA